MMSRAFYEISLRRIALSGMAACACAAWLGAYYGAAFGGTAAFISCWLLFLIAHAMRPGKRELTSCAGFGALFSFFRLFGYSYDAQDSYGMVFKNLNALAGATLAFLSLAALATCALLLLLALTKRIAGRACAPNAQDNPAGTRLFILCAVLIFLGSVPYLTLYSPGLNIFDTHDQLLQFFGFSSYIGDGSALSDHHPVLLTLVYGGFIRLGLLLGDANIGQLIYSLTSMAVIALCYALVLSELYRLGLGKGGVLTIAAGIALYPVLALYAFNMCKDVSVEPFVLLLIWQMIRMERTRGEALKQGLFALGFFAVLMMLMLTRKSSLYAVLFALPFWVLRYPGVRRRMAALVLGAVVLFQVGYTGLLLPACGVVPGETREMLSIPFQQTARYLTLYADDITDEERVAIEDVLDLEYATSHYDPRLSDPVKDSSNPELTSENLISYFKAWASMGLRHPGAYADAWLNMIYGYFYPSDSNTIVCLTLNSPDRGRLTLTQDTSLDALRLKLYNFIYYTLRRLPAVGALFYVDTVTWVFLFLMLVLMMRKGPGAACPHMFLVGIFGISMLSPKSGEIRYLLPILYALPALLGIALTSLVKEDER